VGNKYICSYKRLNTQAPFETDASRVPDDLLCDAKFRSDAATLIVIDNTLSR